MRLLAALSFQNLKKVENGCAAESAQALADSFIISSKSLRTFSGSQNQIQVRTNRHNLGESLSDTFKGLLRTGYSQEYSHVRDDRSSGGPIATLLSLTAALGAIRKDLTLSLVLNSLSFRNKNR